MKIIDADVLLQQNFGDFSRESIIKAIKECPPVYENGYYINFPALYSWYKSGCKTGTSMMHIVMHQDKERHLGYAISKSVDERSELNDYSTPDSFIINPEFTKHYKGCPDDCAAHFRFIQILGESLEREKASRQDMINKNESEFIFEYETFGEHP